MTENKTKLEENIEQVQEDAADEPAAENCSEEPEVCADYNDIKRLKTELEEKDRLLEESTDRLKRLQADFDNFRRRTRLEKEELSNVVAQALILELLPVLDNFERAMVSGTTQDAAALRSGVEMIYRQFFNALEKNGLTPIQAKGESFNPERHEAVMRVEDSDKEEGTIVEELQKGYLVRGKVIRPSMVKVVGN